MKLAHRTALSLALLAVACSPSVANEGMETGPCVDGLCFAGLVCSAGVCVEPLDDDDDDDDGDPTTGNTTTPVTSSSTTTGDASTTEDSGVDPSESMDDSTTGAVATTFGSSTSFGEDSTSYDPSVGFIEDPDVGGPAVECSIWDQDCPAGEKCNAWANDGGTSWNATRCFDIANSPDAVGEVCSVENSGVSGIDSCVEGAICWGVDLETNIGECVAYCGGTELAPVCPAGTECVVTNGGVLALCRETCDPLAQNCPAAQGCYPILDLFVCSPDASGESGFEGDPCEYINVCNPGLACIDDAALPACFGSAGCCSPFCDVDVPDCAAGLECVAAFEDGQAPPGHDDVGYCMLAP